MLKICTVHKSARYIVCSVIDDFNKLIHKSVLI